MLGISQNLSTLSFGSKKIRIQEIKKPKINIVEKKPQINIVEKKTQSEKQYETSNAELKLHKYNIGNLKGLIGDANSKINSYTRELGQITDTIQRNEIEQRIANLQEAIKNYEEQIKNSENTITTILNNYQK